MDLLHLGAQSRKTGIKPRENLTKDKFDMEDIDEFFEETTWQDSRLTTSSKVQLTAVVDMKPQSLNKRTLGVRKIYPIELRDRMTEIEDKPVKESGSVLGKTRAPIDEKKASENRIENALFMNDEPSYPDIEAADIQNDQDDGLEFEQYEEENENLALSPVSPRPLEEENEKKKENDASSGTKRFNAPKASNLTKKMAIRKPKKETPRIAESEIEDAEDSQSEDKGPILPSSDSDDFSDLNYNTQESKLSSQNTQRSQRSSYKPTQEEYITEPSPLPSPPPEGLRRSRRRKIAPLAFWRNERIVYSRANEDDADPDSTLIRDIRKVPLQEIKEVVHIPEQTDKASSTRAKKPKAKKRSKPETYDYESDPEIEGSEWFKNKSLETEVFENEETKKRKVVAWTPDGGSFQLPPASKTGQQVVENFRVAPLFDADLDVIAAGLLDFPFEGFKSLRTTGESLFIFHVAKGLIEVTLNSEKFVVTRGCSLEVPKYNIYSFKNIGQGSARLFFVQCQLGDS